MENLRIGEEEVSFTITSEPYVSLTPRGYSAVVNVLVEGEKEEKMFFITYAKSLSAIIEKHREENNWKFEGIKLKIIKDSSGRFARFIELL